jgi:hypothetical protein
MHTILGQVTTYQERYEGGELVPIRAVRVSRRRTQAYTIGYNRNPILTVWSFSLSWLDEANDTKQSIQVEMRGTELDGTIRQGDWIEVNVEYYNEGEILRPYEVRNHTSNALVTTTPRVTDCSTGIRNMIRGQVSSYQERFERTLHTLTTVWSFRLERQDEAKKPLPRVPVEMRGLEFDGTIRQGDWIEIDAEWNEGTTLRPYKVRNLTSNAVITAKGYTPPPPPPDPTNLSSKVNRIGPRTRRFAKGVLFLVISIICLLVIQFLINL